MLHRSLTIPHPTPPIPQTTNYRRQPTNTHTHTHTQSSPPLPALEDLDRGQGLHLGPSLELLGSNHAAHCGWAVGVGVGWGQGGTGGGGVVVGRSALWMRWGHSLLLLRGSNRGSPEEEGELLQEVWKGHMVQQGRNSAQHTVRQQQGPSWVLGGC